MTQEIIDKAKAEFLQAKGRMVKALENTPDDRIAWSPSPTARTPVQLVAHAAQSIGAIHGMMDGRPFTVENPASADIFFREHEQPLTSRKQALDLLEESSARYVAWLDALTPDQLSTLYTLPFGMGSLPIAVGLTFPPRHTDEHSAQIEYVQTIYGDRDWHF